MEFMQLRIIEKILATLNWMFHFVLGFCSFSVSAQCVEEDNVTYGGDWNFVEYIHLCPTYVFSYGGDTSTVWNIIADPIDMHQAPAEVHKIKSTVDDAMKAYVDTTFYSQIRFESVEVVYPGRISEFLDGGRHVTLEFCKAKYFLYYEYEPTSWAKYHIGVAVDSTGKTLNEFNFPSKADYNPVQSDITVCRLIEIARDKQPNISPVGEVKIEYDANVKTFYWLISQDVVNSHEGWNYFNQVLINASDTTQVNLATGRVNIVY